MVGITDFLKATETSRVDPDWAGATISSTVYLFAALVERGRSSINVGATVRCGRSVSAHSMLPLTNRA